MAAIGASMALAGLAVPVRLSAAARRVSFAPQAFILRRRLERELRGGASLIVVRDWETLMQPAGEGAKIVARQVGCTVDAPPALAALAEIERNREVTGLFPMNLGPDGRIASWSDAPDQGIRPAIEAATEALEAVAIDRSLMHDARAYWATIDKTAAELVSQVPRDLFYPEEGTLTKRRELKLPGGEAGSYEITISAEVQPDSSLLKQSERHIVTRVGSSSRTASEIWSIV